MKVIQEKDSWILEIDYSGFGAIDERTFLMEWFDVPRNTSRLVLPRRNKQ